MASNSAGALVNTVVPFEAGEVVKGALLRQRSTHSRVVSGLIVWNYVWKLAKPAAVATCFVVGLSLGHVFPRGPAMAGGRRGGGVVRAVPGAAAAAAAAARRAADAPAGARAPAFAAGEGGVQAAARLDGEVHSFWEHHPAAYLQVLGMTYVGPLRGPARPLIFSPGGWVCPPIWAAWPSCTPARPWSTTLAMLCRPGSGWGRDRRTCCSRRWVWIPRPRW